MTPPDTAPHGFTIQYSAIQPLDNTSQSQLWILICVFSFLITFFLVFWRLLSRLRMRPLWTESTGHSYGQSWWWSGCFSERCSWWPWWWWDQDRARKGKWDEKEPGCSQLVPAGQASLCPVIQHQFLFTLVTWSRANYIQSIISLLNVSLKYHFTIT